MEYLQKINVAIKSVKVVGATKIKSFVLFEQYIGSAKNKNKIKEAYSQGIKICKNEKHYSVIKFFKKNNQFGPYVTHLVVGY